MPTDQLHELYAGLFRVVVQIKRWSHPHEEVDPPCLGVLFCASRLGEVRMSELAQEMLLDLSTVSRHVRTLVQEGYLERTEDPDDRRACRLRVTDRGRQALQRARELRAAALGEVLASWPAKDRDDLTRLLNRLADDLESKAREKAATR
ncbi:MarR family winged helix-turn-helix transcriptional regulator [Carbonactinospora thermoautotrophica]|uniref:Transcriptional regulator n=1 Tax=Carbonactinospora thermoautotrophica TaxID=1469144 RepID=A0A132MP71_9ACTN|nr:MarR family transcriptional regulator [Carbonactinospora thermoautotrophica]KWW99211.1 Transcriptional regulator [Carbonactinospora thermoautotrophica]